ncbi:MAG: formate dehydrogenase subunit alpha [Chloroflexi bacterium]|nr:formate dehydrogenase subunit alpha [Chloroflexota bacterium]
MEAITITLNGREVSGNPGMTILELARESGVDIPTLCNHPQLAPFGACRICLVEDERSGALSASCVTPIAPGMVINTESPKVQERRRTIIKLMLASHPDSCLVCDKGNRCELRQIASAMGIGLVEFQRIPLLATIEEVNPFIERDLSKCILCAKCIRVDHELVVEGAIDYIHRGFASKPATLNDMPLEHSECTFCGTCVSVCPTGALMEKQRTYRGTAATTVSTTCPFCGCGCSISLEVVDNKIVRARPGKESSVNRGALCVKGSYGHDFVHSPERLTSPLLKTNNGFEKVTWEKALDLVASKLNQIKKEHGPNSLAVFGSSKCTNEENYLLQRFARSVLGTNNIDNGSRLYSAASRIGLGWAVGFPGTTNHLNDLEHSEVILVIGANLTSSAPIVGYAVKRAVRYKGAKLIVVDPQQTKLSSFAHIWLRPKVSTDVALLNGLARVIVTEDLIDEEFVTRRTDNFEAYSKSLEICTPEYVEKITGVPSKDICRAARLFAGADKASIVYGDGITQHVTGTEAVMALANLAMLTGNMGRRGGIYAMQSDRNGQGACDMGALPDLLPGYQSVEDAQARKRFADHWGVSLPADIGLTALEMIEQAKSGKVKVMYIVGENPVLGFPNSALVREALASLDFLVVQDIFLTDTAKLANVVLPAASFAEKDGTFTNFEGRIQRVRRAISPLGESLPDWEITLHLAEKMGQPIKYPSLQKFVDEIEELVPLYRDLGYGVLEKGSPEKRSPGKTELDSKPVGTRRLYKGQFPCGFGRFSPAQHELPAEIPKDGYPLTLLTGSILFHSGDGSRSSRSSRLSKFSPQAYVEIGEHDADLLGISNGSEVKLISPVGGVAAVARITDTLPEGTLFMPSSFPSAPVNQLFDIVLDPRSKAPSLKACKVRLERIGPHGQAEGNPGN